VAKKVSGRESLGVKMHQESGEYCWLRALPNVTSQGLKKQIFVTSVGSCTIWAVAWIPIAKGAIGNE
jgi:hypothetical protein